MHVLGWFVHWRIPEASCSFPVLFRWNELWFLLFYFHWLGLQIVWAFTNSLMLLRWISICFSTFLLLGQPWLVPSASSLLSGGLGQLSKCHGSSGKHEFAHKHTHTPFTTVLLHHSQVLLQLRCWTDEFLCEFLSPPHSSARVGASQTNPSHCTRTNKVIFFFVFIFRPILHCFPQRCFNRNGRKHQEQICCCQLAGNGLRLHRQVY